MLEDIHDGSKFHPSINRIEACFKMSDRIKQGQPELKGSLLSTQNMGNVLHKVFKSIVDDIL